MILFPDWFEQHKAEELPHKVWAMLKKYGRKEGRTCGECDFCVRVGRGNKSFFKCELYGDTASEASDWRLKYPACGKFAEQEPRA